MRGPRAHHMAVLLLLLTVPVMAQEGGESIDPAPEDGAAAVDESEYDPDNGADINEVCAACHGEFGEGGGGGSYPRLAGLPAGYLAAQLRAFKAQERPNIAMAPYATERELPEDDIRDISIFLSRIELLSRMPDFSEEATAYERLLVAKRVFNVARLDGDTTNGRRIYMKSCKTCHGKTGEGRARVPRLAGQFSGYLRDQIELILAGERRHPKVERLFRTHDGADWDDVLAYLSVLDD